MAASVALEQSGAAECEGVNINRPVHARAGQRAGQGMLKLYSSGGLTYCGKFMLFCMFGPGE